MGHRLHLRTDLGGLDICRVHHRRVLTTDRGLAPGQLIHHCDAGSQYTSIRLSEHLALEEIRPCTGTVGDAYDNALAETVNGRYKAECIRTTVFHAGPYKTIADIEFATTGRVD